MVVVVEVVSDSTTISVLEKCPRNCEQWRVRTQANGLGLEVVLSMESLKKKHNEKMMHLEIPLAVPLTAMNPEFRGCSLLFQKVRAKSKLGWLVNICPMSSTIIISESVNI